MVGTQMSGGHQMCVEGVGDVDADSSTALQITAMGEHEKLEYTIVHSIIGPLDLQLRSHDCHNFRAPSVSRGFFCTATPATYVGGAC